MIEMQGALDPTDKNFGNKKRNNIEIGELSVELDENTGDEKAVLVMGNHTLEGAVKTLKKPLMIVKKTHTKVPSGIKAMLTADDGKGESERRMSQVLQVEALIKRKAVFKARATIGVPKELVRPPPVKKKLAKK